MTDGKHYSRANERAILAIFMMAPESHKFIHLIKPEWFYDDRNRTVCNAILAICETGSFSIQAVNTYLLSKGVTNLGQDFTAWYLTECSRGITGVHGFRYGLAMLEGMYKLRQAEVRAQTKTIFSRSNYPTNDFE